MHRHQAHEFTLRAEAMTPSDILRSATIVTYDALYRFGRELGFPEVSLAKLGKVRAAVCACSPSDTPVT